MVKISGYRFMWIQVLFDLPVTTKSERRLATKFRQSLLDMGFEMAQFSVYQRFCDRERVDAFVDKVRKVVPSSGKVHILKFTDKQYENIITFNGADEIKKQKNPEQYSLF